MEHAFLLADGVGHKLTSAVDVVAENIKVVGDFRAWIGVVGDFHAWIGIVGDCHGQIGVVGGFRALAVGRLLLVSHYSPRGS